LREFERHYSELERCNTYRNPVAVEVLTFAMKQATVRSATRQIANTSPVTMASVAAAAHCRQDAHLLLLLLTVLRALPKADVSATATKSKPLVIPARLQVSFRPSQMHWRLMNMLDLQMCFLCCCGIT